MLEYDVLIIGATGMIGQALITTLVKSSSHQARQFKIVGTGRQNAGNDLVETTIHLDLLDPTSFEQLKAYRFSCVCLFAGISDIRWIEENREQSNQLNVKAYQSLIDFIHRHSIAPHIVYLSSNMVFDGQVQMPMVADVCLSENTYGEQKRAIEVYLSQNFPSSSIIRLSKVLGPSFPLFSSMLEKLERGESVEVFDDKYFSPVSMSFVTQFLASLLFSLTDKRATRDKLGSVIYQLSGDKNYSYAQALAFLAEHFGISLAGIVPVSSESKGIEPVLNGGMAFTVHDVGHFRPPTLAQALQDFIVERTALKNNTQKNESECAIVNGEKQ